MNITRAVPIDAGPANALVRAFAGGSLLVAVYDPGDVLHYASAAFKRAFALEEVGEAMTFTELIIRGVERGIGPKIDCQDPQKFIADTQGRRRGQPGQRYFATDMLDGNWYWMTETLLDDGWIVLVGSEISPLKEMERLLTSACQQASYEARTDALTGLANRREVLAFLGHAISTVTGPDTPLSVALIDLDRFKGINDEHGHLVGDAVLCDFACLAREVTRCTDVIGRIGGEEFLLVMPGTTANAAVQLAERLRSEVACRGTPCAGGSRVEYSISAGVTQVWCEDRVDDAFSRADRALYEAKSRGRNRISVV